MRTQGWRSPVEHGQAWSLTAEQVTILTTRYAPQAISNQTYEADAVATEEADEHDEQADGGVSLADLSVGELLSRYANVLAELRERHLVRTHNAPIGDLAEYCAAVVYDGLLAPNSEKSFDLTTADERRVQVKVRQLRPGGSRAAVFSPIRSFGFDLSIFIVIDTVSGDVIAAREWTAAEVREHGSFKTHTNGTVITVSKVLAKAARGEDRTADFAAAWRTLLGQNREAVR
jgi:hypothetical protein